ncbi:hypothetical protein P9112_006368 [Eukaryota sp. TZLM1-RC]
MSDHCPICLFRPSHELIVLHSTSVDHCFCLLCLFDLISGSSETNGTVSCPLCREKVEVSLNDVIQGDFGFFLAHLPLLDKSSSLNSLISRFGSATFFAQRNNLLSRFRQELAGYSSIVVPSSFHLGCRKRAVAHSFCEGIRAFYNSLSKSQTELGLSTTDLTHLHNIIADVDKAARAWQHKATETLICSSTAVEILQSLFYTLLDNDENQLEVHLQGLSQLHVDDKSLFMGLYPILQLGICQLFLAQISSELKQTILEKLASILSDATNKVFDLLNGESIEESPLSLFGFDLPTWFDCSIIDSLNMDISSITFEVFRQSTSLVDNLHNAKKDIDFLVTHLCLKPHVSEMLTEFLKNYCSKEPTHHSLLLLCANLFGTTNCANVESASFDSVCQEISDLNVSAIDSNFHRLGAGDDEKLKCIVGEIKKDLASDEHIWFHGTTTNSAKVIMDRGINLFMNPDGLGDFHKSCEPFFYLTQSPLYARSWGFAPKASFVRTECSVLVYKISSAYMSSCHQLDHQCNNGTRSEWSQAVTYFRSDGKKEKDMSQRVQNLSLIGPISDNKFQFFNPSDEFDFEVCSNIRGSIDRVRSDKFTKQLCVKSEDLAEHLNKNLLCEFRFTRQ